MSTTQTQTLPTAAASAPSSYSVMQGPPRTHTARLIFTVLFLIFAVSAIVQGAALSGFFWLLVAAAVGYPFVRGGKLDLNYPDMEIVRQ